MFSVLIANYNNWKYFQDCYNSLEQQTVKDFEVVVLDDCSTDDSFARLQEFACTRSKIRIFQNPENKGVGFTKNRLITLAKGEFCAFLDPDDALLKTPSSKAKRS